MLQTITLLIGFALLVACNNSTNNKPSSLQGFEEKIDLVKHPMTELRGQFQIKYCKKSILLDQLLPMPVTADSIPNDAFQTMKDSALALRDTFSGNYLLALKINYGLDETSSKMLLYYQPLFLKRITPTGKSHIEFQPQNSPHYYYYDNTKKLFAYEPDFKKVTEAFGRYGKHVYFKTTGGHFRACYPGNSDTSDVQACIFPFQEIDEMVKDNQATHVYIINSGEDINVKGKAFLRQVMILGPDSLEHHVRGVFYRKYANLTHLCPPNCHQHFFDLK